MSKKNFEAMIEEAKDSLKNRETRIDAYYEAADNAPLFDKKKPINVTEIFENDKLCHIYPIADETLSKIVESMKSKDYDVAEPVTVWLNPEKNRYEVIDGHTRLKAAKIVGFKTIPCVVKPFTTIEQAVEYAHHRQRDRRNLTPEELLYYATEKREHKHGEGRDSDIKAKELGVSRSTIDRLKFIADNATPEQLEAYRKSEIAAQALEEEIKNKQFVEDNADEIEKDMIKAGLITPKEFVKDKKAKQAVSKDEPSVTDIDTESVEVKIKTAYESGFKKGLEKADFFVERLFYYMLTLQKEGKTPDEIKATIPDLTLEAIDDLRLTNSQRRIMNEFDYMWLERSL